MPNDARIFYQILAQPVPGSAQLAIPLLESSRHYPWSEPVRQRIAPRLAIALMASGIFTPVLNPSSQIINAFESGWHQPWSEPVRQKKGLPRHLQQYQLMRVAVQASVNRLITWFSPLMDPVRQRVSLKSYLQQTTAFEPRLLPNPNITGVMSAVEINADILLFGIDVFSSVQPVYIAIAGANVTINEIPALGTGAASISENT